MNYSAFTLPPENAIAFFSAKGFQPTFSYLDMYGREHATAFTVAKMLDMDLLKDIRSALDDAISKGKTLRDFTNEVMPLMQQKGWWGRQDVVNPITGDVYKAELGSARRLENIFRTNMQSAYAAGEWEAIQNSTDTHPYLMYDAIDDGRTREQHRAWDNLVIRVDDEFWLVHFPPNGWGCRCSVIQLTEEDVEELGLTPTSPDISETRIWINPKTGESFRVPVGIDPGFDFNPGLFRGQYVQRLLSDKAMALPEDMVRPMIEWLRTEKRRRMREGLSAVGYQATINRLMKAFEFKKSDPIPDDPDWLHMQSVRNRGVKRGGKVEYGLVYDEKSGQVIIDKEGGVNRVSFSPSEIDRIKELSNGVLIHNHPSSYPLSIPDVKVAAIYNLNRMVAIGNNGSSIYKVSPIIYGQEMIDRIDWADKFISRKLWPMVNDRSLTAEQAGAFHYHTMWRILDEVGAVKYEFEKPIYYIGEVIGILGNERLTELMKEAVDEYRRLFD